MNTAGNPEASCLLCQRVIEVECGDSSATLRGQADDLCATGAPAKMTAPVIPARMKQTNAPASARITRELLLAFELIAERTTQTEIVKFRCAACHAWRDVVNVKPRHRHFLRGLTVFTAIPGSTNDSLAEFW